MAFTSQEKMTIDQIVENSRASITKEDLRKLLLLLSNKEIKNILEIGTWKGYSSRVWLDFFEPDKFMTMEKDEEVIVEEWIGKKGCDSLYLKCDSHNEESLTKAKTFFHSEIDFLFIDGDHGYEGVKQDWEMYRPLVKPGGVIVLHDVVYTALNPDVQVKPLWDELKRDNKYVEIKSGQDSTGMGVIFV